MPGFMPVSRHCSTPIASSVVVGIGARRIPGSCFGMAAIPEHAVLAQALPSERYAALVARMQQQIRRRLALHNDLATKWTSPPHTSA